jgi:hypothetical protein
MLGFTIAGRDALWQSELFYLRLIRIAGIGVFTEPPGAVRNYPDNSTWAIGLAFLMPLELSFPAGSLLAGEAGVLIA